MRASVCGGDSQIVTWTLRVANQCREVLPQRKMAGAVHEVLLARVHLQLGYGPRDCLSGRRRISGRKTVDALFRAPIIVQIRPLVKYFFKQIKKRPESRFS